MKAQAKDEQQVFLDERDEALRERLRETLRRDGISQTDAARAMGVSAAALSQWMGGSYRGDCDALRARVEAFLGVSDARAEMPEMPAFAEIGVAKDVLRVCEIAQIRRVVGVIYGDAGVGKTVALKEYVRRHPECIYVRANPSFSSPQPLLRATLWALGRDARNIYALDLALEQVIDQLEGTGRLVIYDEAQFMGQRTLETVRTIHDVAGIGIVLAGNYDVYNRMNGGGSALWAQLFSRVGIKRRVTLSISKEDVQAVFGGDGQVVDRLWSVARQPGGLRRAVQIWQMAKATAVGRQITVADLEAVESLVGG
jgi:DNA transposition AAA+ family ATPase